ncbi:MAG: hypothetical protein HQL08_02010 [Nitrospirae bacterium]|nr:hypothetical protein [Nitrospirota bacterium]
MKVLHILNDGHNTLAAQIARIQDENNEVNTIDLSANNLSYEYVIESIFSSDRVISWHGEEENN